MYLILALMTCFCYFKHHYMSTLFTQFIFFRILQIGINVNTTKSYSTLLISPGFLISLGFLRYDNSMTRETVGQKPLLFRKWVFILWLYTSMCHNCITYQNQAQVEFLSVIRGSKCIALHFYQLWL